MSARAVETVALHWGHVDARPTSLHGNGAAALGRTTLNPSLVDCRLCVSLLASTDALSWVDRQGDVWRMNDADGLMYAPKTAPFPREHVEKKWGPLRLVDPRTRPAMSGLSDPA